MQSLQELIKSQGWFQLGRLDAPQAGQKKSSPSCPLILRMLSTALISCRTRLSINILLIVGCRLLLKVSYMPISPRHTCPMIMTCTWKPSFIIASNIVSSKLLSCWAVVILTLPLSISIYIGMGCRLKVKGNSTRVTEICAVL